MVITFKSEHLNSEGNNRPKKKQSGAIRTIASGESSCPAYGVVYSRQMDYRPFDTPPLEAYEAIIGAERIDRVRQAAESLRGSRILELNATFNGGGVAEMLFSSVPFINNLGIELDWKVINGSETFFESTKGLHNMLQGMKGVLTPDMENAYTGTIQDCARSDITGNDYDIIMVNDPQPLGLASILKKTSETWLWRCHIDMEDMSSDSNPGLMEFMTNWIRPFDAAIFSAPHYVIPRWSIPNFIIPPFIDPLSEKNRELEESEISRVLDKYEIEKNIPTIVQVGRFDPWKGLDRTIAVFRKARKEMKCQLILAGGLASDDPEGERILARLYESTRNDDDIHILKLSLSDRLQNWREVNALQRAASVIMQPSTREGFGLVITEALWKARPVIATNAGAIPLQIREGETGYFYENPQKTARRVIRILQNPGIARKLAQKARVYVGEHFLMPDRIADYLMAMNLASRRNGYHALPDGSVISFHPWYKMSLCRRGQPRPAAN